MTKIGPDDRQEHVLTFLSVHPPLRGCSLKLAPIKVFLTYISGKSLWLKFRHTNSRVNADVSMLPQIPCILYPQSVEQPMDDIMAES